MMLATDSTMSTRPRAATMPGFVPATKAKATRFTLIELLVVVAIIAILMAILLPSLSRAKDMAKDITCKSNMKQHALAFNLYATDNSGWYPMQHGFDGATLDGDASRSCSYQAGRYQNRWWNVNGPTSKDGRPAQNFLTPAYMDNCEIWVCPSNRYTGAHVNWAFWKAKAAQGIFSGSGNYNSSYIAVRPLISHGGGVTQDYYFKDGAGSIYRKTHGSIGGNTLFRALPVMPLTADIAIDAKDGSNLYSNTGSGYVYNKFPHINHFNYSRVDGSIGQSVVKGRVFGNYTQDIKDAVVLTRSDTGAGMTPVFQGDFGPFIRNCNPGASWSHPGPGSCQWHGW